VDPEGWSGASAILPDGRLAVILNPQDTFTRQNITLMEEIVHEYLGHRPSLKADGNSGLALREFNRSCEKQAYAVAAAAILPASRLELLAREGLTVADIAARDEVSPQLVSYRINVAGVRELTVPGPR
jgi:Zn-dependent peptidase ImmA (M78 family)